MTRQTLYCHLRVWKNSLPILRPTECIYYKKIIKIVQAVSFRGIFFTNTVTQNIYTLEIQDTNRIHFNLLPLPVSEKKGRQKGGKRFPV